MALTAGLPLAGQPAARKGRLKQAVARWCFQKWSVEELARNAAQLGIEGIDL